MAIAKFFKNQKEGTQVKINFYKSYIELYLIKVLMQFGICFVGDLFCGPGKSGNKNGSPFVLIEEIEKVITISQLITRFSEPQVVLLFNDINQEIDVPIPER